MDNYLVQYLVQKMELLLVVEMVNYLVQLMVIEKVPL